MALAPLSLMRAHPPALPPLSFSVSFSPVEYGRRERGRLIIQTEETTWSYEVTGESYDIIV